MLVSGGRTARIALTPAGPIAGDGNCFSPSAPALRAAKHSEGDNTPGHDAIFSDLVSLTTSGSKLGETIMRPPALATSRTSSMLRTVPAPTVATDPKAFVNRARRSSGYGEFNGISIVVIPASIRIS